MEGHNTDSDLDQDEGQEMTDDVPTTVKGKREKKEHKPGIIYLSSVPEFMSVQRLRNVFGDFGEVNRTFFQPVEKSYTFKKGLLFTEGWVEFKKRKIAKHVAKVLNNTQVGGKKKNPWFNCIWNIKYLPKFTWTDVNADRELKRATFDSRIRADISQVKKQTNFYVSSMEQGKVLEDMKRKREKKGKVFEKRSFGEGIRQRLTDEEIVQSQQGKKRKSGGRAGGSGEEKKEAKRPKTFSGDDVDASRAFVMKNIFGSGS